MQLTHTIKALSLLSCLIFTASFAETVSVIDDQASFYVDGKVAEKLSTSTELKVIDRKGDWVGVSYLSNGVEIKGWINQKNVITITEPSPPIQTPAPIFQTKQAATKKVSIQQEEPITKPAEPTIKQKRATAQKKNQLIQRIKSIEKQRIKKAKAKLEDNRSFKLMDVNFKSAKYNWEAFNKRYFSMNKRDQGKQLDEFKKQRSRYLAIKKPYDKAVFQIKKRIKSDYNKFHNNSLRLLRKIKAGQFLDIDDKTISEVLEMKNFRGKLP